MNLYTVHQISDMPPAGLTSGQLNLSLQPTNRHISPPFLPRKYVRISKHGKTYFKEFKKDFFSEKMLGSKRRENTTLKFRKGKWIGLGYRIKANCPLVGPGPTRSVPPCVWEGGLSKGS